MTSRPLAALTLALVGCLAGGRAHAGPLEVRFLDVGQGDATLLTHEGQHVLIDTGPSDAIAATLRTLGVRELALLLISHNHADHMGGADAILTGLPVKRYLDNELAAKTKIQSLILDLLALKQVSLVEPRGALTFGDLTLRILPPPANVGGDEQNNASVGLVVEHGKFRALLTGDSEVEELNAWLAAGLIPDVDVAKAAHHGSRNGVTPLLLHRSKPEVVVISCGAGNDYGHPHDAALRYYHAGGRRVLRTDLDGAVRVSVDTVGAYLIETSRPRDPAAPVTGAATPPVEPPGSRCCRVCKLGKPCGDGCVAPDARCTKPPGCACQAGPVGSQ